MRRAPAEDEVEGQDDEFLFRLTRGADLLAKGDLEAARAALGRARELRPSDPQVLGLLGQSLYKLGRFDDAAELYELLVVESPIEAAARVNLGLA
ncbi:MAG: tetratricopeptide repeat protein, partial [Anaeromyxobacteraceae bacterium]